MDNWSPLIRRAFSTTAIAAVLVTGLGGCGGDDSGAAGGSAVAHTSASAAAVATTQIVPPGGTFNGRTYAQWQASFWQWALALPTGPVPHPFQDCTNRSISADQSGDVWYWSAPDAKLTCNQSGTIIPPGKAIFLTTLDVEASSLDSPPFYATTPADQLAIARQFANYIQDIFVEIDGIPVRNVMAYRATTQQFGFNAPSPWAFGDVGGTGTAVGDGYFLMLRLPPGSHTIHYGGIFQIPKGVVDKKPVTINKDITLLVTVGG
ncbi:hypothetical protein [Caballeronia grimmiae]|uniref:hypothetical protein n=1 Tax=Caballeronia grimmiae TaxID=1071679 RepID=UPI0038B875A2